MIDNTLLNNQKDAGIAGEPGVDFKLTITNSVHADDIPVYDIISVYLHAFRPEDIYEEKIAGLAHLFGLEKENIKTILYGMDVPRIVTLLEIKRYLEKLSTQNLEKIYHALIRQHFYPSARQLATITEGIFERRNKVENLFRKTSAILNEINDESEIHLWNHFELDFSAEVYPKEYIIDKIGSHTADASLTACIYAIYNGPKCLYIGTGNLTDKSIRANYYAYSHLDNTTRWIEFFSRYKKNLELYWKGLKLEMSDAAGSGLLALADVILREIHNPLFDKFDGVHH